MLHMPQPRETDTPSRSIASRVKTFNSISDEAPVAGISRSKTPSRFERASSSSKNDAPVRNMKRRMSTGLAKRLHAFEELQDPQNYTSPKKGPKQGHAVALPGMQLGTTPTTNKDDDGDDAAAVEPPRTPKTPRSRARMQPRPPPKLHGLKIDRDALEEDEEERERDHERRERRHRRERERESERDCREEDVESDDYSSSSSRKRSSSKARRARSRSRSRSRHATRGHSKSRRKSRSRSRHRHASSGSRRTSDRESSEWSEADERDVLSSPRKRVSDMEPYMMTPMTPPFSPASDVLSNPADSPQPHIVLRERGAMKNGSLDLGAVQPLTNLSLSGARPTPLYTPMEVAEVADRTAELHQANHGLYAELSDLRGHHENLKSAHERACADLDATRADLSSAQFANNQLQNRLHRVEHELDDLKVKKSQSSARTEDLEQQIVSLKISLTAAKTSVDQLQRQVADFEAVKSRNASLSGEVKSMSEQVTEVADLRRKVDTLQNDLAAKQKDLEQAEEFEIKLEEEIQYSKDLDNSYSQINEGYAKLYESYCNNLEELEDMRQKNHDFRDELKACSLYIRSQAERVSGYAQPVHIDILDQEVHLEAQELRQKNLELRAREKTLFKANYERTEEVCRIRERNSMLDKQIDALERQLKRTQDEKASLSPSFGSMRQKELDEQEFKEEISELRRIIDQKDTTISSLQLEAQDTFTKNTMLFGEMRAREEDLKREIEEQEDEMMSTMRKLSDLQAEIERRDTEFLTHIDYSKELTNTGRFSALSSTDVGGGGDNDSSYTIRELTRENESLRVELENYLDMAQRGEFTPEIAQRITSTPRHRSRTGGPQLPPKKPSKKLQIQALKTTPAVGQLASASEQQGVADAEKRSAVLQPQQQQQAASASPTERNVFELPKQFFDMQQKKGGESKTTGGGNALGFFELRGDSDAQHNFTTKLHTRLMRNKTSKKENHNLSNTSTQNQEETKPKPRRRFSLSKRIAAAPSASGATPRPTRATDGTPSASAATSAAPLAKRLAKSTRPDATPAPQRAPAKHNQRTSTPLKHTLATTANGGKISITASGPGVVVNTTGGKTSKTSSAATAKPSKGSDAVVGKATAAAAASPAAKRARSRSRTRHRAGAVRSSSRTRHADSSTGGAKVPQSEDAANANASGGQRTWRKRFSKRWRGRGSLRGAFDVAAEDREE